MTPLIEKMRYEAMEFLFRNKEGTPAFEDAKRTIKCIIKEHFGVVSLATIPADYRLSALDKIRQLNGKGPDETAIPEGWSDYRI